MQRRPTQEEVFQCLSVLRDEAKKHHVSPRRLDFLEKLVMVESGGCQIQADGSNAYGIAQVIPKTWNSHAKEFGLEPTYSPKGDGRHDIRQQSIFLIKSTDHNVRVLKRRTGIMEPSDGQLYLMHFAGENVAVNTINLAKKENGVNIPIQYVLSQDALDSNGYKTEKNKGVRINFKDGGYLPLSSFKVGDFLNWSNGKMGLPAEYKTDSVPQYEKNKFGIPESAGDWVKGAAIVGLVIAAAVGIGNWIFGGDDAEAKSPPPPPKRPPSRSRA
jgi:hypothetical protein